MTEMREMKYTEHDIRLAEELGGIKTLQNTILEKLNSYCNTNEEQHIAMWKKIDNHGKKINWIIGIGTGIAGVGAVVWDWLSKPRG